LGAISRKKGEKKEMHRNTRVPRQYGAIALKRDCFIVAKGVSTKKKGGDFRLARYHPSDLDVLDEGRGQKVSSNNAYGNEGTPAAERQEAVADEDVVSVPPSRTRTERAKTRN